MDRTPTDAPVPATRLFCPRHWPHKQEGDAIEKDGGGLWAARLKTVDPQLCELHLIPFKFMLRLRADHKAMALGQSSIALTLSTQDGRGFCKSAPSLLAETLSRAFRGIVSPDLMSRRPQKGATQRTWVDVPR